MVRAARVVPFVLALLVVIAGCATPFASDGAGPADSTDGSDGPSQLPPALDAPGPAPTTNGSGPGPASAQADPDSDVLGWEDGYWYNDPVAAEGGEQLDDEQLDAVIARAMARVEYVRGLEFEESVNVSVVSRAEFGSDQLGRGNETPALRAFDNAKFQALFLIGPGKDSIDVQDESLNTSVGGYYNTEKRAIVIVADGGQPTLDTEKTLAHELVHALQEQHFPDADEPERLRDAVNGHNGLYEGDANAVQHTYMDRCRNAQWRCLSSDEGPPDEGAGGDLHFGVYLLDFFPYADGPGLIAHLGADTGWAGVDDAYDRSPNSATEVIYPERYGSFEPRDVELADDVRGGWERIRPDERPDYGRMGQSALAAMFAYTGFDSYNETALVDQRDVINAGIFGQLDRTDPINYDLPSTRGWTGDRFHAYQRGDDVASVWRLTWDSQSAAERFAENYRGLLSHWGGERVDPGTWRIGDDSPFTGAIYLEVEGDTVTVVGGPSEGALGEVYPGAR